MKKIKKIILGIISLPLAIIGVLLCGITIPIAVSMLPIVVLFDWLKDDMSISTEYLHGFLILAGIGIVIYLDIIWDIDLF